MKRRDLVSAEHFVRFCSRQKQLRDEEGKLIGVTWAAFSLRPEIKETYLSGCLLEFVDGDYSARVNSVLGVQRNSGFAVKPQHAMAICNVGLVKDNGSKRNRSLRLIHEPKKHNIAYSAMRGLPLDNSDTELLSLIAADSVVDWILVADIDKQVAAIVGAENAGESAMEQLAVHGPEEDTKVKPENESGSSSDAGAKGVS